MPISSINTQPKVNPADIPLEKLAASKTLTEEQKTVEMTRQFEAVLLRQILTEAHKPMFKSDTAAKGVSADIYQDMMVNQLADKISSSRTVGLAQELEKQVSRQAGGKKATEAVEPTKFRAHSAHVNQSHNNHAAEPAIPRTKAPRL